ncbi:Alpha/Beta hydrolase protein [Calycina marina]|uniref:Alpha/Beta hydrolase protein n=1 Tax=Calycina marina TaxID=1763456 RepID=A0A9P7Z1Z0_9HELO|nr:Alpha/Beta hydrolase protein [Calycina marina]
MRFFTTTLVLLSALVVSVLGQACDTDAPVSEGRDDNGSNFTYPYPVQFYNFTSQEQSLQMAYMDVEPSSLVDFMGTITLLHGKFYCASTWNETIAFLVGQGYRVIAVDQVGFCKSSKPVGYQFSFMQLASNTNSLLNSIGITSTILMGHSMGGMLSLRYSLMFPSEVSELMVLDPLGLENWFIKGVPYQTIDAGFVTESARTWDSIKTYEETYYYTSNWSCSYDIWVTQLFNIYQGSQGTQFAYNMAQTTDMIFTQPVVYELYNLSMPSLLMVGQNDTTSIGNTWASAAVDLTLGHYPVLAEEAHEVIEDNTLVIFPNVGHSAQVSEPDLFQSTILAWLNR